MLPKRPRSHRLEDESRKAFEGLLPSRLVFRSEQREYGIDGELEEFAPSDEATGRRFRVQLKGTDQSGKSAMRARIKLTTAAYYRAQQLPVLMVRYVAPTKRLYARWFHEFDPYYERVGKRHLTFHWSETDLLTTRRFDELFAQVDRIVRLKGAGLELPLTIAVEIPAGGAHGSARAELDLAVDAALARCPGVLTRAETDVQPDLNIAIEEEQIRAGLAGLASVTFHLESELYSPENAPSEIAADALNAVAASLARAGHGEPAARLAVEFFAGSAFSAVVPLAAELAAAMLQTGRVVEVIEIAERLDQDEATSCQESGVGFMQLVRERVRSLRRHEHERFEIALRARLDRRLRAGRTRDAAGAAENLGRYLLNAHRPWDAIEPLEQSIQLDSGREPDLASDLAGAYFLSGRYEESVSAYERAISLSNGSDDWLDARRADAHLYAGHYRDALEGFSNVESDDRDLGAWVYVKRRALEWVIRSTGVERQARAPDAAEQLAGKWHDVDTPKAGDALAAEVWEQDAVSGLGWFNRARDLLDRDLESDAMHAYLTTAVMQEGDVEAWVNVAILAINVDDPDLFAASAITGRRLNSESYLTEFSRQLRLMVADLSARDNMLEMVKHVTELDS